MDEFKGTKVQIPCCVCGVKIEPNPSNMCIDCLQASMDVAGGVPTQAELVYCRDCGRYQVSHTGWAAYELESPELLQLCLKKIPGVSKFKVLDSKFLWTEPHSKRIRVQVTIVREDSNGTALQQSTIITYFVKTVQCKTCQELATKRDHWKVIVQLRQKSSSQRTMLWIEQMIIAHKAAAATAAIERKPDGLDFQFNDKPNADKFVAFLKGYLPLDGQLSTAQKGQDLVNMKYDTRYTYSLHIPPVSREDLVLMPTKNYKFPLGIILRMGRSMTIVDPFTGNTMAVDGRLFWAHPFEPLMQHKELKKFAVLESEILEENEKFAVAEVELVDADTYDDRVIVRSHLGKLLGPGDEVMAYDLRTASLTDVAEKAINKIDFEKIVIVSKCRGEAKTKKKRNWHLQRLAPAWESRRGGDESNDDELNEFMDEIEDDDELRNEVVLIKDM